MASKLKTVLEHAPDPGGADEGQAMAEYAILALCIAIVVIAAAALFGASLSSVFVSVAGWF